MWDELWRIEALLETGRLAAAAEELPAWQVAVERVGGVAERAGLNIQTLRYYERRGPPARSAAATGYTRPRRWRCSG